MQSSEIYGVLMRAQSVALLSILSGLPVGDSLPEGSAVLTRTVFISCWQRLPLSQKMGLLHEEATKELIAKGKSDEVDPAFDPEETLMKYVVEAEEALQAAGYGFFEGDDGHFWVNEKNDTQSEYFPVREDAILSAAMDSSAMLDENEG